MRAGFGELLRERAVVGHQQQSFTCVVETPYGINALANTLYQIHDRGTPLRVVHGGDITFRLVEREIEKLLAARKRGAVDGDFVAIGISFGAEFGDHFTIQRDPMRGDQLLGFAA